MFKSLVSRNLMKEINSANEQLIIFYNTYFCMLICQLSLLKILTHTVNGLYI